MADAKITSSTTAPINDLADAAGTLGTSLARVSALVVSLPFIILPDKEREDAVAATTQLFTAVGELHLRLVRATARGFSNAARQMANSVEG
jgi:hypothetical protein